MTSNNRACATCKFYSKQTLSGTKRVGWFRKRTELVSYTTTSCTRFGPTPWKLEAARGDFHWNSPGTIHGYYEYTDGPCGAEGKFWEDAAEQQANSLLPKLNQCGETCERARLCPACLKEQT